MRFAAIAVFSWGPSMADDASNVTFLADHRLSPEVKANGSLGATPLPSMVQRVVALQASGAGDESDRLVLRSSGTTTIDKIYPFREIVSPDLKFAMVTLKEVLP